MNPSGFGIFVEVGWKILGAERSQVQVLSPRLVFRSGIRCPFFLMPLKILSHLVIDAESDPTLRLLRTLLALNSEW